MGDQRWRREPVERLQMRGEGVVGRNEVGRGGVVGGGGICTGPRRRRRPPGLPRRGMSGAAAACRPGGRAHSSGWPSSTPPP